MSIRQLRAIVVRLSGLFGRERRDRELAEELESHLQMHIEDNLRAGLTAGEARRQALIKLGGLEPTKERYRRQRGLPLVESLAQDLRYGVRTLVKNPGFTVVAALTLALGIAVNASIFSIVSGVLLKRPPVHDPDRVVMVVSTNAAIAWGGDRNRVSVPDFIDWREQNGVFEDIAAADAYGTRSLTGQGEPERVNSMRVSASFFSVLGVPAALGRTFLPGEDRPGREHVVILSHEFWQRRFGSDPTLTGKTLNLDGESYNVVGVMPASFRLISFQAQLWTPLVFSADQLGPAARQSRFLHLFARLKPGVSLDEARADMATLARRAEQSYPETEKGWGASAWTLQEYMILDSNFRPALMMFMCAVVLVLLIACANVAGLLLARGAARAKEIGIRAALGAGRWRVIRQLLIESLLIATIGGSLGLLLSVWGIKLLHAGLSFNEEVRSVEFGLDGRVLMFTLAVSALTALLFGLAPAFEATRVDIVSTLKNEGPAASAGPARSRLRRVLVAGEIALTLTLLTGTGLIIEGVAQAMRLSLGFNPSPVLACDVSLSGSRYPDGSKQAAFLREVVRQLEGLPGVQSAAATTSLAATGAEKVAFSIAGRPEPPASERPLARHYVISSGYLRTMGIPLMKGRDFSDADDTTAPGAVLVSEALVRRFFAGEEPLGKSISVETNASGRPEWREIVGVVGNVKNWPGQTYDDPQIYEPYPQRPAPAMTLVVRDSSDPNALAPAVRRAVWAVDKDQPLGRVISMTELLAEEAAGDYLFGMIFGIFSCLALLLSAVGIYGVVAYSVGQRTHEIGVRVALGAQKINVLRLVLGEAMKLTLFGTLAGLVAALPLPHVFESALQDFHVHAPWLYVVTPVLIAVVTSLACYVPARRAIKVDPMIALRYE